MKTRQRHFNTKALVSVLLALSMMIACVPVCGVSASARGGGELPSQYAQETVAGGAILHCFNWSYNSIAAKLDEIRAAGYTAVQTSPVQKPKDYKWEGVVYNDTTGQWWKLYQPLGLSIADEVDGEATTWLGTKAELANLCTEAHERDIKVIVDIVANHLANNGTKGGTFSNIDPNIDPGLKNARFFHSISAEIDYSSEDRYNLTQRHMGQPDLNTGDSIVQQKVLALLEECVDVGVDGFRFDAAKHIELPTDPSNCKSEFWNVVAGGIKDYKSNVFLYGEVLGGAGNNTDISQYTDLFAVTDNQTGNNALSNARNGYQGGLAAYAYQKDPSGTHDPSDFVIWAESHDTYIEDGDGATRYVDDHWIVKTWAIVGSRQGSTSLYLARPNDIMGEASSNEDWKSTAVAEVNKFKNFFNGTSEYLSSASNPNGYGVAYNERGTSGVVICNLSSEGDVDLEAHRMASGTYTDQVTGNTFTVSNGRIRGHVGPTGVAVVYNPEQDPFEEQTEYYLFGWINGADYACEGDSQNMGEYRFVNGKLTARFAQDSYVAVKEGNNRAWYMTDGYPGNDATSATLYDTNTLGNNANKLRVPAGTTYDFTLTNNNDGTFTLSYEAAKPKFTGNSLALGSRLGLVFRITVPEGYDSTGAKVTFDGGEITFITSAEHEEGTNDYTFTYYVDATDMGKPVTAVYSDDSGYTCSQSFGANDYFDTFSSIAGSYTSKEQDMVKATSVYCHYMVDYLNAIHGTSNPGVDLTDAQQELTDDDIETAKAELSEYTIVRDTGNSGIESVGVSLRLESRTSICLYLTKKADYQGDVTVIAKGDPLEYTVQPDGSLLCIVTDIPPDLLQETVFVKITAGESIWVQVSALAYANTLMNSDNPEANTRAAQLAMTALYYYYVQAANYAE